MGQSWKEFYVLRTKRGKRDEIAEFYKVGKLLFHLLWRLMPCVQMSSGPRDQNPIYKKARRGDYIAHKVNSTLANKLDTPGKGILNKKEMSLTTTSILIGWQLLVDNAVWVATFAYIRSRNTFSNIFIKPQCRKSELQMNQLMCSLTHCCGEHTVTRSQMAWWQIVTKSQIMTNCHKS